MVRPLLRYQRSIGINYRSLPCYFSVSPLKNSAEFCDHCDAFCKLTVEGRRSICKTAAGSGAGVGLRPITGSSVIGAVELPASGNQIPGKSSRAVGAGCVKSSEAF